MKRKYELSKKLIKEWKEFMEETAEFNYSGYSDQRLRKEAYEWFDSLYSPKRPRKRRKRTKLFYKTILIIRSEKLQRVTPSMLKTKFKLGYLRTSDLFIELKDEGIIMKNLPTSTFSKYGKIIWKNVKKVRVPKEYKF